MNPQRSSNYLERNLVARNAVGKLFKEVKETDSVVGKPGSGHPAPRKVLTNLSQLERVGLIKSNPPPKWTPNHSS
jgi:hypothetical protein